MMKTDCGDHGPSLRVVLAVFFASGFCALLYQVIWLNMLDKVFGVTTYAASAVLGAYFGGLALGGYLGGRLADRHGGLAVYGAIEIALGLTAVAVPAQLAALISAYRTLHALAGGNPSLVVPARFALSFAVLVVPATLIGMTLPVLVRALTSRHDEIGQQLPRLYAWNTAGSVLGALLTGYVLIGLLVIKLSMFIAVGLNILTGIVAVAVSRIRRASRTVVDSSDSQNSIARNTSWRWHTTALAVTFCSGLGALGYEVAWFRILGLLSDHRAHTFSAIVAVVLIGIGAGSLLVERSNRRATDPARLLTAVLLGLGMAGLTWLRIVAGVSSAVAILSGLFVPVPTKSGVPFAVSLAITLLPCVLMGMSFPLAVQVYARQSAGVGESVGRMYALNLIGAMAGSVLTGFVLLPAVGAQITLLILSTVFFAAAALLLRADGRWTPTHAVGGAAFLAAAIAVFSTGDGLKTLFSRLYPLARVLESREDVEATVTIAEQQSRRIMYINGVHQADDSPEMINVHRLIGVVPSVVHGDVLDALVVGMGGGTTAGEVARFTTRSLTIVEISPAVVEAARAFGAYNGNIVDSSNAETLIGDGRNYLLTTDRRFDLITADTIQPLLAHSGNLYSRDYYRLMASRLKRQGIVFQWIDVSLREHEERILMRTFVSAFPYAAMWERSGYKFLIGSNEPLAIDQKPLPDEFHASSMLTDAQLRSAIGSGPIITDDRPVNEYFNLLRIGGLWKWLSVQSAAYQPT